MRLKAQANSARQYARIRNEGDTTNGAASASSTPPASSQACRAPLRAPPWPAATGSAAAGTAATSLPIRPAGRTNSTSAMIRKMTTLEPSGYTTLVKPSTTPSSSPAVMAPSVEPSPPITTTAKTTMMLAPSCVLAW